MNRGNAKQAAPGHGAAAAIADYRTADSMLQPAVTADEIAYMPAFDLYLRNASRLILALREIGAAAEAMDIGDAALAVARRLEASGITALRGRRRQVFAVTLNAYIEAGSVGGLPDLILEHLDPAQPGSACDSLPMHEAAAVALQQATRLVERAGDAKKEAELAPPLRNAERRLAFLRALYFGGTVQAARFRAGLALDRGDAAAAAEAYADYLRVRPLDPEGWLARAVFRTGRDDYPGAEADYLAVVRLAIARSHPDQPEDVGRVAALAAAILRLRLIAGGLRAEAVAALQAWLTGDAADALLPQLLANLPRSAAAAGAAWRAALQPALLHLWHSEAEPLVGLPTDRIAGEIARLKGALSEAEEDLRRRVRSLRMTDADYDAGLKGFFDAMQEWVGVPGYDIEIDAGLQRYLREAIARLGPDGFAPQKAALGQILNLVWTEVLNDSERMHLAAALKALELLAEMAKRPARTDEEKRDRTNARTVMIQALQAGFEQVVVNRIVEPRRQPRLDLGRRPGKRDSESMHLYVHFAGTKTLGGGHVVGVLRYAIKRLPSRERVPLGSSLKDRVTALLAQAPNLAALRLNDRRAVKRRQASLDQLVELRNAVTHATRDPTDDEFPAIWQALVLDKEDAFFRYFPAAFMPPVAPPARPPGNDRPPRAID